MAIGQRCWEVLTAWSLGPVHDTISNCEEVLIGELNSANDNPLVFHETEEVLHGGNFHGDYVSLEMDKLGLVVTRMSILSERQLNTSEISPVSTDQMDLSSWRPPQLRMNR